MHLLDIESVRQQPGMVLVLDDDERVARHDLVRYVPRGGRGAGAAADPQSRALSQRVQRQSAMLADDDALGGLDRSGFGAQIAAQEFLERPLADEADAGAVRLVEYR